MYDGWYEDTVNGGLRVINHSYRALCTKYITYYLKAAALLLTVFV
jgi:hypothetical protein